MWTTIKSTRRGQSGRLFGWMALWFVSLPTALFASSFTEPLFESLNLSALRSEHERLAAIPSRSDAEIVRFLQVGYFYAEALGLREAVHAKFERLDTLDTLCVELEAREFSTLEKADERARAAFSCALVVTDRLSRAIQFAHASYANRVHKLMAVGSGAQADNADRIYAEGRVYYRLSAKYGGSIGRSLLSWQILKRLQPQASSIDFWLGRIYQLQGNEEKAQAAFEAALARQDPRANVFFEAAAYRRNPDHLDGLSWGIRPALFLSPVAGFGGVVDYHDDRLWDTRREGAIALTASTQGSYGVSLRVRDRASLAASELLLNLRFGVFNHEFYGVGIGSVAADRSVLTTQEFSGRIGFKRLFFEYAFAEVGWLFEAHNVRDVSGTSFGAANLTDRNQSFGSGPFGRLGFDSRDSHVAPRRGLLAFIEAQFPSQVLGSQRDFERWHTEVQFFYALGTQHGLQFSAGAEWVRGDVPYGWYPRLRGSFKLPGLRRDRYQDQAAGVLAAEYRLRVWEPLSLAGFLTAGRVANTPGGLFQLPYKLGAGLAVQLHPADLYAPRVRFEFGVFGQETVFQGVGYASF